MNQGPGFHGSVVSRFRVQGPVNQGLWYQGPGLYGSGVSRLRVQGIRVQGLRSRVPGSRVPGFMTLRARVKGLILGIQF